ncbi:MAG TPA: hypothetical protein VEQ42_02625, partial [Pyrinomonadaceae bacterium]|nr:hypothetical protein [Pyrinomonadaceae bacterium]
MKPSFRPRAFLLPSVLTAALCFACLFYARARADSNAAAAEPAYDLVITNARVVDGTGNPWFRADV